MDFIAYFFPSPFLATRFTYVLLLKHVEEKYLGKVAGPDDSAEGVFVGEVGEDSDGTEPFEPDALLLRSAAVELVGALEPYQSEARPTLFLTSRLQHPRRALHHPHSWVSQSQFHHVGLRVHLLFGLIQRCYLAGDETTSGEDVVARLIKGAGGAEQWSLTQLGLVLEPCHGPLPPDEGLAGLNMLLGHVEY